MRWWLVAAWAFAAVMCGVVLWPDTHFVICEDWDGNETLTVVRFGCFRYVVEFVSRNEPESLRDPPASVERESKPFTYEEMKAEALWRDSPEASRIRPILVRLSRAGLALFCIALGAAALGLLAVLLRGRHPSFGHGALLVAGFLPLTALERLGVGVHALFDEWMRDAPADLGHTLSATGTTWVARIAWGGLAVAAAISWWRWPKRQVTPVDPEVFE